MRVVSTHLHTCTHMLICMQTHIDFRSYLSCAYYLVTDKGLTAWTCATWNDLYTREKEPGRWIEKKNWEDEVRIFKVEEKMSDLRFKPECLLELHLGGCLCTPRIVSWITGSSRACVLEWMISRWQFCCGMLSTLGIEDLAVKYGPLGVVFED